MLFFHLGLGRPPPGSFWYVFCSSVLLLSASPFLLYVARKVLTFLNHHLPQSSHFSILTFLNLYHVSLFPWSAHFLIHLKLSGYSVNNLKTNPIVAVLRWNSSYSCHLLREPDVQIYLRWCVWEHTVGQQSTTIYVLCKLFPFFWCNSW